MTLHICVLGIDGSGKSTVSATLPILLAAELDALAGSAGEEFSIVGPLEDHLGPGFHPDGLPVSARCAMRFKRMAKRVVDNRALYPALKLAHLISQDNAAMKLSARYGADAMVSDGNLLLSAMGRAGNYTRPASEGSRAKAPDAADLAAAFAFIIDGTPLPEKSKAVLPSLAKARALRSTLQALGIHASWLPDVVIFLDLSPHEATRRILGRGEKVDLHENIADLAQAREGYLKTLAALRRHKPSVRVHTIKVDTLTPGATLQQAVQAVRSQVLAHKRGSIVSAAPLGTTEGLSEKSFLRRLLTFNYLGRYLVGNFFRGAWREPFFILSRMGRELLKEGYSAGVMTTIYNQDSARPGILERIYLGYPLHRAVYDRLQILTANIRPEIEERLGRKKVTIFSAPSGFAYDIFRPLDAIAVKNPRALRHVHVVAADLDPHGVIEKELTQRAKKLGITFTFIRGDITKTTTQAHFKRHGPFDIALFVGLSGWLPKPPLVRHLRFLRDNLRKNGMFVTDCFQAHAYSLAGRYVGYKAQYYTPQVYTALLDYCGFDGMHAMVEPGRDLIDHVIMTVRR